jgi:N-acetylglucosaminyl-diphospho-decaprenol L-rhamnosyltransferase
MPAERRPDLSIVIVTHNGLDMAIATLESARAAVGETEVEWFIVDSGSTDGTPEEIERRYPDMTVLRRDNIGFAAGNNVALPEARGRYVLLLNPDIEVLEGTLAGLVEVMDADPSIGAAGVLHEDPEGRLLPYIKRFPSPARQLGESLFAYRLPGLTHLQERVVEAEPYERQSDADWVAGAFMIVRDEVIRQVGPLDERFFLYAEETDWCLRIKQAGWRVAYLPVMKVRHYGGNRPGPQLSAQLTYAKLQYASKHFGPLRRALLRLSLIAGYVLRVAGAGLMSLARPAARERVRAEARSLLVAAGVHGSPFPPPPSEAR